MEGKINSEDPVFVSEHHISITYHSSGFIFIPAIIFCLLLSVFCLSTKLKRQGGYCMNTWHGDKKKNSLDSRHLVLTYNTDDSA